MSKMEVIFFPSKSSTSQLLASLSPDQKRGSHSRILSPYPTSPRPVCSILQWLLSMAITPAQSLLSLL